jgi:hypothetical protein
VSVIPTWREQYDRVKRWHARLTESAPVDERRRDDFYAFFTCCFHLKDWLKADAGVDPEIKPNVEALFHKDTGQRWLQVCADLANGSKHLAITRNVRVDPSTRLEKVAAAFDAGAFDPSAFQTEDALVVYADGGAWEALELADQCVKLWGTFLRSRDLLAPIRK